MQKEVISLNLSIVIPCFNEQERLPKTLHTFFEFLNRFEFMFQTPMYALAFGFKTR